MPGPPSTLKTWTFLKTTQKNGLPRPLKIWTFSIIIQKDGQLMWSNNSLIPMKSNPHTAGNAATLTRNMIQQSKCSSGRNTNTTRKWTQETKILFKTAHSRVSHLSDIRLKKLIFKSQWWRTFLIRWRKQKTVYMS